MAIMHSKIQDYDLCFLCRFFLWCSSFGHCLFTGSPNIGRANAAMQLVPVASSRSLTHSLNVVRFIFLLFPFYEYIGYHHNFNREEIMPSIPYNIHGIPINIPDDIPFWMFELWNTDLDPIQGNAHEMRNFIDLTKDKKCLLDIGALFGIFCLAFSTDQSKVSHAVEPASQGYDRLLQMLEFNPGKNITPHRCLISESTGLVVPLCSEWLHVSVNGSSMDGYPKVDAMTSITIDDLCEQKGIQQDCIKIDVEGYELKILPSAEKTISRYKPTIFLEAHQMFFNRYSTGYEAGCAELTSLFASWDYISKDFYGNPIQDLHTFLMSRPLSRIVCMPK